MNKFIEEQLQKCKVAKIETISEDEFFIHKKKETDGVIQLNNYYLIELADYIIHPNENFTLAANWNKGVVPKSKLLKAMITQTLGKMIKVDAVSDEDENEVYFGLWLPMGGVKVVKKL